MRRERVSPYVDLFIQKILKLTHYRLTDGEIDTLRSAIFQAILDAFGEWE